MLRSVIVIAGKDPALIDGGAESYIRAYGRAARRVGYEPHHFCVSTRDDVEETEFGVIHRTRSPFRPFRGLMVAAHERYIVDCVDRFVGQQNGCQLIHSFGAWSGVGVATAQRLRKRGIKTVTAATSWGTYHHETLGKLRGLRGRRPSLIWLQYEWELLWTCMMVDPSERRGFYGSDVVLVNYDSVRQIILNLFGNGITFGKMTYASEVAFLNARAKRGAVPEEIARLEPTDAPLLVAVSRHDPRKGVDVLLRALANLRKAGIQFRACLVGGGPLLAAHRQLVERFGLSTCTAVPGRVPDAYAYLEHADVFALPSLEEGSGSVSLLEALQSGAAAVVSRVDGLPEDVIDGHSALLVEPGDATALAAALGRLLTDPDLRARIARGGHQRYREQFSAEAFAADVKRVYSNLGFAPLPSSETKVDPVIVSRKYD
jgi:glycosyltransferase involved in cell wall biosynthesis